MKLLLILIPIVVVSCASNPNFDAEKHLNEKHNIKHDRRMEVIPEKVEPMPEKRRERVEVPKQVQPKPEKIQPKKKPNKGKKKGKK
jgi:hypothetical protein